MKDIILPLKDHVTNTYTYISRTFFLFGIRSFAILNGIIKILALEINLQKVCCGYEALGEETWNLKFCSTFI